MNSLRLTSCQWSRASARKSPPSQWHWDPWVVLDTCASISICIPRHLELGSRDRNTSIGVVQLSLRILWQVRVEYIRVLTLFFRISSLTRRVRSEPSLHYSRLFSRCFTARGGRSSRPQAVNDFSSEGGQLADSRQVMELNIWGGSGQSSVTGKQGELSNNFYMLSLSICDFTVLTWYFRILTYSLSFLARVSCLLSTRTWFPEGCDFAIFQNRAFPRFGWWIAGKHR